MDNSFLQRILLIILIVVLCIIVYQFFLTINFSKTCPIHKTQELPNIVVNINKNSLQEHDQEQQNTQNIRNIRNTQEHDQEQQNTQNTQNIRNIQNLQNIPNTSQHSSLLPVNVIMREYDYRTLRDPLVPPLVRDDYNVPIIPIATRGYPSSYKKMGLLVNSEAVNNDKFKFLLLIGRQKYPGSNFYDYYVTDGSEHPTLKFDLPNLHKEVNSDDKIKIDELNTTYTVKMDRNLGYEYNPYIV